MLVLTMSKINGYLPCPPPNTKNLESFQSIICPIFHVFVCGEVGTGGGRKVCFISDAGNWCGGLGEGAEVEKGRLLSKGQFTPSYPPHPTSPQPPLLTFNQARIFIERGRGLHLETVQSSLSYLYFEYKPLN